jgi:hypothetical protein
LGPVIALDVSDPLHPIDVDHHEMPGKVHGMFVSDEYACVVGLEKREEGFAGLM